MICLLHILATPFCELIDEPLPLVTYTVRGWTEPYRTVSGAPVIHASYVSVCPSTIAVYHI